jgi:Transcriptional regulator/sugar kinase
MNNEMILALDIGGTAIKSGIFSQADFKKNKALLEVLNPVPMQEQSFDFIKKAVLEAVGNGLKKYKITSISISTTGSVNEEGILLSGPDQFVGYEMINWSQILKQNFNSIQRVHVVNDGKASAWAEYSYHATGLSSHVHFVLGTGVGSSVVVNGTLINGDSGEAGFLGHTRVTNDSTNICTCGKQGCLETIASAPGLVYEYNKTALIPLGSFDDFQSALASRNPIARDVLTKACDHFGNVISVLANALNPSYVTFGGGVILGIRAALAELDEEDYFIQRISEQLTHCTFERTAKTTKLRYAALNNDGGLIGASLLAFNAWSL